MKQLGKCFMCERVMPMKFLESVEYYTGHSIETKDFHHKLICKGCLKKTEDIYPKHNCSIS